MGTAELTKRLTNHLSKRPDFLVLTTNLSWALAFEADVLMVNTSNEIIEFEIKRTRGDFLKDKKKVRNGVSKYDFILGESKFSNYFQSKRPAKFYYCCPSGLISRDEIPSEFGLIHILASGQVCIIKRAKKLHEEKIDNAFAFDVARNFCIKQCKI